MLVIFCDSWGPRGYKRAIGGGLTDLFERERRSGLSCSRFLKSFMLLEITVYRCVTVTVTVKVTVAVTVAVTVTADFGNGLSLCARDS